MPYIEQNDRAEILTIPSKIGNVNVSRKEIGGYMGQAMRNGGDLQYMLAVAIQVYLENKGLRYQNCQDIMGALTGANAEFIRCIVSPYEEKKIANNGAVYNII